MSSRTSGWISSLLLLAVLSTTSALAQVSFSKTPYGTNQSPANVITGDFSRDGLPDFAVLEAGNMLTVYLNTGAGHFSKKAQYAIVDNNNALSMDTADMNGDGKLDIVIGKQYTPEFEIWYGNGDGTFTFGKDVATSSPDAYDFALADINHDGHVDFFNIYNDDSNSTAFSYLNDGSANFTEVFGPTFSSFVTNFGVADFDRDGKLDILVRVHDQLQEYSGDGTGTFTLHAISPVVSGFGTITIGSFNHDNSLDVATRVWNCDVSPCNSSSRNEVSIYLNDGTGHFGLRSRYTAGVGMGGAGADFPTPATFAADLNGDGIQDVLLPGADVVNGNSVSLQYLLNTGDGHFTGPFSAGSFTRQDQPVVRDLNRDGRHDLVFPANSTYVMLNTNAAVMCTPPGSASLSIHLCGPANNATVGTTFTVGAGGNSPAGVIRMELWLDGKKAFELWNDQLKRSVTVGAGRHKVSVVAVDRFSKTTIKTVYVQAQ